MTLFSPQCRECVHCLDPRTNLCLAIREQQNQGFLPDGTTRLSRDGEPIRHFMGTSTFAEYTVMPEIALAKIDPEAPLDRGCALRLRALDRARRGDEHGEGRAGLDVRRLRRRPRRARRGRRLPAAGRRADRRGRPLRRSGSSSRAARARPRRCSRGPDVVEQILELTGGFGADYTFEATGRVDVMRQAVEAARMGWGLAHGLRRRRQGRDARRRPALPDHRPPRRRLLVRRRQGPRPGAPARRPLARGRDRRRPARSRHTLAARRGQPRLRADGGAGRHPQRDRSSR